MRESKAKLGLVYFAIALVVVGSLFPIVWMILTSLKQLVDIYSLPPVLISKPPVIDNWLVFFSSKGQWEGTDVLAVFLPNSLIVSLATAGAVMLLGTFAAHSLARYDFRGKTVAMLTIIGVRMLPPIITAIPLYIFYSSLGAIDTLYALFLSYLAFTLPFAIWLLSGFIHEIPVEIEEAAMVDGSSRMSALFRIILPLAGPGIAATSIFTFLWVWNDFQLAYFLVSHHAKTLPLVAASFSTEMGVSFGPMSAFGTLTLIPAIIFAVIAQKYLIRGLTMGAVKA